MAATSATATTVFINDTFHPGDECGNATCDVVGNRNSFDIQKVVLSYETDSNMVTAAVFLNYGNDTLSPFKVSGITLNIGDLLFGEDGQWLYGVPVEAHAGSPNGGPSSGTVEAGHLYQINNGSGILTAGQVLNYPNAEYRPAAPVWLRNQGGSLTELTGTGGTQIVSTNGDGVTAGRIHADVTFLATPEFLSAFNSPGFSFQWASATCGNDVISLATPEPVSTVLIGGGLVFLGLMRRRRGTSAV